MSALSAAATLPLVALASPSIAQADPNGYSRPDLAVRFEDLCARHRARWEYDRVTTAADYDDPEFDGWTLLSDECAALGKEILNMRAASIADIVLQARAVALENNDMWRDQSAIEYMHVGQHFTRLLIDRICQFAGIPIFGDAAIAPLVTAAPVMPEDDRLFSETNDPAIVLAQEALQVCDRKETQYLRLSSVKKAMAQWERRNPRPVMREVTYPIAALVLGDDAKRWPDIAAILEREGLPRIDPLTGRRFRPAVEAFLLRRHGVTQEFVPTQADGVENWPVQS